MSSSDDHESDDFVETVVAAVDDAREEIVRHTVATNLVSVAPASKSESPSSATIDAVDGHVQAIGENEATISTVQAVAEHASSVSAAAIQSQIATSTVIDLQRAAEKKKGESKGLGMLGLGVKTSAPDLGVLDPHNSSLAIGGSEAKPAASVSVIEKNQLPVAAEGVPDAHLPVLLRRLEQGERPARRAPLPPEKVRRALADGEYEYSYDGYAHDYSLSSSAASSATDGLADSWSAEVSVEHMQAGALPDFADAYDEQHWAAKQRKRLAAATKKRRRESAAAAARRSSAAAGVGGGVQELRATILRKLRFAARNPDKDALADDEHGGGGLLDDDDGDEAWWDIGGDACCSVRCCASKTCALMQCTLGVILCGAGCCCCQWCPSPYRDYAAMLWRRRVPFTRACYIAPVILVLAALTALSVVSWIGSPRNDGSSIATRTEWWQVFVISAALAGSLVVWHMLAGLARIALQVVSKRAFWATEFLFYFDVVKYTVATLLWAVSGSGIVRLLAPLELQRTPTPIELLVPVGDGGNATAAAALAADESAVLAYGTLLFLFRTWVAVVFVCIMRIVLSIGMRVVVVRLQRALLWRRIFAYLMREKMLQILLRPPMRSAAPAAATYKRYVERMTQLPTLVGRVNPFHFNRDLIGADEVPSQHQFVAAWASILGKNVLGVLPSKTQSDSNHTMRQAVATAEEIFVNVAGNRGSITFDDVGRFFEDSRDAERAFEILNSVNSVTRNIVTRGNLVTLVHSTFKDRKALYRTLESREKLSKLLNHVVDIIFWLLMSAVVALIYGADFTTFLVPLGTSALALTFVFGSSLQRVWENILFIYTTRAFDVGDRIMLPGSPRVLLVKAINLMTTEVYSTEGQMLILPNFELRSTIITQLKRSRDYLIDLSFNISVDTSDGQLQALEADVRRYLRQQQLNDVPYAVDSMLYWVDGVDHGSNVMLLRMAVALKGINWQNRAAFLIPRSDLFRKVRKIMEQLAISQTAPTLPVEMTKMQSKEKEE